MNEKIITLLTDFLARNSEKEYRPGSDDYEILRYGLAVIYYTITKTILLLAVAVALNILPYTLAFMAVFGGLRMYARGLHLKSNFGCTVLGFANYMVGIYISIHFDIGLLLTVIIYLICVSLNAIYAPSPTENSPISESEKLPLKFKTIIIMGGLFIVMLVIGNNAYRNIILMATVIETLHILPITYKIFKEKRN